MRLFRLGIRRRGNPDGLPINQRDRFRFPNPNSLPNTTLTPSHLTTTATLHHLQSSRHLSPSTTPHSPIYHSNNHQNGSGLVSPHRRRRRCCQQRQAQGHPDRRRPRLRFHEQGQQQQGRRRCPGPHRQGRRRQAPLQGHGFGHCRLRVSFSQTPNTRSWSWRQSWRELTEQALRRVMAGGRLWETASPAGHDHWHILLGEEDLPPGKYLP
ncbi:hypothetical protein QBC39DRAFT_19243 [Podospora conica]|nr:hypothetical protein QBC39DRAFT_19243 [Schizothecium conicum]